ncbi:hypothetical protein BASA81_002184 [Batrachochytrium salamandrivorans]|nr:hypothetical protein BASA81_002184 [Batrachochytrium salamandrivorans]
MMEQSFPPLPPALGGNAESHKNNSNLSKSEFGYFYFKEQGKLCIMQLLVFIELVMTTSSLVVYVLCAGGIFLLLFFTLLVRLVKQEDSLILLYPALLMITACLLSVVTLVKVFWAHEQTEFALTFLGITFTVDHLLLMSEAVKKNAEFALMNFKYDEVAQGQHWLAMVWDFVLYCFVLLAIVSAGVIGLVHLPVAGLVYCVLKTWLVPRYVADAETTVYGTTKNAPQTNEVVEHGLMLWLSVLVVDIEFCVVAGVCSYVSGGLQTGGTSILSQQLCACGGVGIVLNSSGCFQM